MAATTFLKKTTDLQDERAARDLAIYNEYQTLAAIEGQSKTEINKFLMKKYNLHSNGTLYAIRKRAEERLRREGKNSTLKSRQASTRRINKNNKI